MNKTISFIVLALVVTAVWFIPDLAFADPSPSSGASGGFVTCNGSDCSFCHIIDLGSNILNWLFGLVFVLFGVIAFVAGFGLATSGGNQAKLDDAKKKLSNAFVGLIIVFSAWLIVDTLMKALVPGGETSIGPWNAIDCGEAGQAGPVAGDGISVRSVEEIIADSVLIDTYVGPTDVAEYADFISNCLSSGGSPIVREELPDTVECRVL